MSQLLRLLHVSDLHYEADKEFDRAIVIKALIESIREQRASGMQFDAVIFSGDLVHAGDSTDSFAKVTQSFIQPLLDAAAVPTEKFILCAGNHDISKKSVVPFIDDGLKSNLSSVTKINEFIDSSLKTPDAPAIKAVFARMEAFEAFYNGLRTGEHKSSTPFFKTRILTLCGVNVGFAILNSAWRATGENTDKNALIIGERAVDLAIADLENVDLRIFVAHHPVDWLLDCDSVAIENRLLSSFDLLCFGHTHRALPQLRVSPMGATVVSQAGALYASRKYFNGYQIIEWDESARKVLFRCLTYIDEGRRKFVPAENLAPGGIFEVQLKPRESKPVTTEMEIFLRQGRTAIRASADEHISFARPKGEGRRDDIGEAFVCPPLSLRPTSELMIKGETDAERMKREIDPDAMLRDTRDIILLGHSESGRTSLLHYLATRVAEGVSDIARIPAIINTPLCIREANYERSLKAYYADTEIRPADMNSAIKNLQWMVFLDDFNGADDRHIKLAKEIKARHPLHRVMIVVANSASIRLCEEALGGEPALRVEMEFLSRRNIRQLSRVRFSGKLDNGLDDPAYLMVMKHINEARLPRTGYMVALLLWAAEQDRIGENINEAVLLENLVSFLLGKTNFEAALRNQFDPRAQEILLRAIAVELRKTGGWMESNLLLEFIIEYFRSRGLGHGAMEVLAEFIACRLLVEQDGYVGFRYSCYQEYFVALDLRQDNKKLGALLASENTDTILGYSRELDLWSSLSREMEGVDRVLLKILESAGLDPNSALGELGDVKFNGKEFTFRRSRIKELLDNPPTKDQIDEILDKADDAKNSVERKPPGAHNVPAAEQPSEPDSKAELRARAALIVRQRRGLDILARVVRNSDHEKIEIKTAATRSVLKLWSRHTFALLTLLADLISEFAASENSNSSKLTEDDLEKLTNIFKFMFAFVDATNVASILTSESLRAPMKKMAGDETEPEGLRFFAAIAYAETWDRDGIELVRTVLKDMHNRVLKQAAYQKMLNDYRLQRYRTACADEFRNLIVETEIHVFGIPQKEKGARVAALEQQEDR
jgi:predicted MPP superfamily phosphohydrolase